MRQWRRVGNAVHSEALPGPVNEILTATVCGMEVQHVLLTPAQVPICAYTVMCHRDMFSLWAAAWLHSLSIGFRRGPGQSVSGKASEAIGAVFQALLEAALRDAAAGAFEDEEEDEGTGVSSSPRLRML